MTFFLSLLKIVVIRYFIQLLVSSFVQVYLRKHKKNIRYFTGLKEFLTNCIIEVFKQKKQTVMSNMKMVLLIIFIPIIPMSRIMSLGVHTFNNKLQMDVLRNPFDPNKYLVVESYIVSVSLGVQFVKNQKRMSFCVRELS